MTEPIDLTWFDGIPHRLTDPGIGRLQPRTVRGRNGREVVQPTCEFAVATARPASAAEIEQWQDQP